MKAVCKLIGAGWVLTALTALSFNTFAEQHDALFIGKLDLRSKQAISELNQVSTAQASADSPYFFDRTHLYFTQIVDSQEKQEMDVMVWDLSTKKVRRVVRLIEGGSSSLVIASGDKVVREKNNEEPELRAVSPNAKPETYFVHNEAKDKAEINAYQFEKSNWYLYAHNQQKNELKAYNIKSKKTIVVAPLPQGSEFFSVSATGHVIASDGNKLYQRQVIAKGEHLQAEGDWRPMNISSAFCQSGISKTAISRYGDMIALVCMN